MTNRIFKVLLITLSLTAFVGCAASNVAERVAARRAIFERHAGAPVQAIPAFRLDRFETLGADALVVWAGPARVYLITLERPCFGLELRYSVGVTSSGSQVRPRFDAVTFIEQPSRMLQRCTIETIRPVDYAAVRAERQRRGG